MAQVLFGQSYFLQFDPKLWEAMQPYPPLGTLYAASYLRQLDYDVALFDAMLAPSEAGWALALDREKPEFAVIFEDNFNYLSKMCLLRMREAAFVMIDMAKQRGCTVIVCGADGTDHATRYLAEGADYILLGEGEFTLGELLDHLSGKSNLPLDEILGIAFSDPDDTGQISRTPRRPDNKDLDSLPFPAWDLIDVTSYKEIWYKHHGYYSMNMVTTRGCPYHCNWCAKPIWGQRYNVRTPENVVAEMKWLNQEFEPDHIWFADDIMGLKPRWLPKFADLLGNENLKIPFKCLSRVDLLLREGEIDAMKRAGAQIIWVGAESGSQKILTAMEKGTRVDQIHEVRHRLLEAGVQVGFFLQFGYPGETRADVENTLQLIRETMPDDIGMSVSYPLPGTKFFERIQGQLGDKQNWYDSSDLAMMYGGPFTTDFYRQLHTVLHKEFRARKYLKNLKLLLRHPAEFKPVHIRQTAAMVYHAASLPYERSRLNRLENLSQRGIGPLPPGMSAEEASRPSPQGEV
jgi:anaerobic magnesium-protoporphyrin IX monomethyl ester cyclase